MLKWPNTLVSDVARRRVVIFLGSGISKHAQNDQGRCPRTWLELLQSLAPKVKPNRHILSLLKEKDYLTACEVIKEAVGKESFHDALRDEFLSPEYRAADIHKIIFRLDSRIVATPNFDKIYESYANSEAHGSIVIKHHYDPDIAEAIRGTDRLILKIHGTIDSPDRMIFSRNEYAAAREKYRGFYLVLEALALTHTFLFLGCGVNDPDTRLLLEDTTFRHPGARPHIFVLPRQGLHKSVESSIQKSMNLCILTYSSSNNHGELVARLKTLAELVEEARENLRNTGNW